MGWWIFGLCWPSLPIFFQYDEATPNHIKPIPRGKTLLSIYGSRHRGSNPRGDANYQGPQFQRVAGLVVFAHARAPLRRRFPLSKARAHSAHRFALPQPHRPRSPHKQQNCRRKQKARPFRAALGKEEERSDLRSRKPEAACRPRPCRAARRRAGRSRTAPEPRPG